MKQWFRWKQTISLFLALILIPTFLSGCSNGSGGDASGAADKPETDTARYLVAVEDEPDTVDFQCTSIHYTVAQNVFNRLVETEISADGSHVLMPSLAERWEISPDRLRYTFHLRRGVVFSNGSPLTSSDVLYTFTRLLTHPDACNQDIADAILGAEALKRGESDSLAGFQTLNDLDFAVTLEKPFEAFLACLSMPGASILDEETTKKAGALFGADPAWTIGTGSFILKSWEPGRGMLLKANPACWQGPPACEGLDLRFMTDAEDIRLLFERGGLDILNLDDIGKSSEFFLHGDVYADRLHRVPRIGIAYIAFNESVPPLNDARVRKALQLALNRTLLLDAAYSGHGSLENGVMPRGLYGFSPELPEIPYDPDAAKALLTEAGLADGFSLSFGISAASSLSEIALIRAACAMWAEIGVRAEMNVMPESEFMRLRKSGRLACYCASWSADYDDPDNFFSTFFGSPENTAFRSLCYPREDIMARVTEARAIADEKARTEEYRALERIIVQQDAAWAPLFSRFAFYVSSSRLQGFQAAWNGSVKAKYREMTIREGNKR